MLFLLTMLPRIAATTFVGIVIVDKASGKHHIQSVKSILSSVMSIMYKIPKSIISTGMYTLYYPLSIVLLIHIIYCNGILGNTYS